MALDYTEIIIAFILGGWNTIQHFQIKKCKSCPLFIENERRRENGDIQPIPQD